MWSNSNQANSGGVVQQYNLANGRGAAQQMMAVLILRGDVSTNLLCFLGVWSNNNQGNGGERSTVSHLFTSKANLAVYRYV